MPRVKKSTKAKSTIILSKGNYVPGTGPSNPKIAFVGEAPGADEERKGEPFVGNAGKRQNELCNEAGIDFYAECYRTNLVKYRPPMNDFTRFDEIGINVEEEVRKTFNELNQLNPNIVVALGDKPLFYLTGKKGITKYRGSILPSLYGNFKVLPTFHPSAIVRSENPWGGEEGEANLQGKRIIVAEVVVADLIKVKKESLTSKFTTPHRKLEIIKDAHTLKKFLDSYIDKEPSIDIEASYCFPVCIAIAFTPWHSVSVPLVPIHGCKGEIKLTQTEYADIWQVLSEWLNRDDIRFVGSNLKYDLEKLIAPAKLLHPYVRNKVAGDTAMMMGILYPELPRRLEFATSIFTNEPFYKDEGKNFNPKKDPAEQLLFYNAKDAAVAKEIKINIDKEFSEIKRSEQLPQAKNTSDSLKDFYYNYISKLTDFYMDIEAEGLDVDFKRREELKSEYKSDIKKIHEENVKLLGTDYNPRSYTKDVPRIITEILNLPPRKGYGEEQIVSLLGNNTEPNSREAIVLQNILRERQALTNFNYLEAATDADGRMRSSWNPTGTETGRSTTSPLKPPLRPFDEKPEQIGLAFGTLPKHGPFAEKIRGIFVAPPGYVFLERDYSQAEARIVALLSNDDETLKLFDTTDIHKLTASWIVNVPPEQITEDQRFLGKTGRHAGNYGEGKHKLMLDANANALKFGINIKLSEKDAQNIITTFHSRTPKIRNIFQSEVTLVVQKTRTLWNPYGRVRQFFGLLKNTEAFAQIPQSTVPDSLRLAGLRLKEKYPWLRFCLELYDAFVWKVREDKVDEVLRITKEELEQPIDFKYCSLPRGKIVIPTEAKVGKRLNEMKKVKE